MNNKKILVEISARHAHITEEHLEILFGRNASLTPKKPLSQPGQYASEERIDVVGPRGTLKGVTILGPTRPATQVEITLTEARQLGLMAPIRESGNIDLSSGCTLVGPIGSVEIKEGVIVAKRHIHLRPDEATAFNVVDKQKVAVSIQSDQRSIVFDDVVVRVSDKFSSAMHIDTDEANAGGLAGEVYGEIITT